MDRADRPELREAAVAKTPTRPKRERDLQFTRMRPVQWFSPAVLLTSAQRLVVSSAFGGFLDKRELQAAVEADVPVLRAEGREVWFDYLADTGDGFDPTYSVAWLAAQRRLDVPTAGSLPRGQMLVLGGDEVYPVGTPSDYENRFTRPFEASLPRTERNSPWMLAVPGNHDWYDGLTNFARVFCQGKWIGGRRTVQTRSYFAVELVGGWWLWGIDIQFDSYIDEPQLQYFEKAAKQMGPGGRVILCTAKPSWVDVAANEESFRNLAYLESRLIRQAGGRLMLSLSGDSHHYAHYTARDGSHKITSGGGGAFLHPTHHLDPTLDVPDEPRGEKRQLFELQDRYPSRRDSEKMSWGALKLPLKNPSFLFLPIGLYLLLGVAAAFGLRAEAGGRRAAGHDVGSAADMARRLGWLDILKDLVTNPFTALLLGLVAAGLVGFAKPPEGIRDAKVRKRKKRRLGVAHVVAQVAVGTLLSWAILKLPWPDGEVTFGIVWLILVVLLGAVASSLTMGLYLAVCCRFRRAHGNEAFSAMALTQYKNFLRIHITSDGTLTVYPIGIDQANDRWRIDGDNPDIEASWLVPDGVTLHPHLIDKPVIIRPQPTGSSAPTPGGPSPGARSSQAGPAA